MGFIDKNCAATILFIFSTTSILISSANLMLFENKNNILLYWIIMNVIVFIIAFILKIKK